MKPADRLQEASKQIKLAARDLDVTQQDAAEGMADVVDALALSVATLEDAEIEVRTDGSGCFWCESTTDYHPTCDGPGCENQTHGHGPEGQTVDAYCADCKGVTATDGGSSCNCAHIRGVCTECSPRVATDGSGATVEEIAARAENLRYLAESIESVDWGQVPGVSATTAATFVQDIIDASDRLRRRHVDTDGSRA